MKLGRKINDYVEPPSRFIFLKNWKYFLLQAGNKSETYIQNYPSVIPTNMWGRLITRPVLQANVTTIKLLYYI